MSFWGKIKDKDRKNRGYVQGKRKDKKESSGERVKFMQKGLRNMYMDNSAWGNGWVSRLSLFVRVSSSDPLRIEDELPQQEQASPMYFAGRTSIKLLYPLDAVKLYLLQWHVPSSLLNSSPFFKKIFFFSKLSAEDPIFFPVESCLNSGLNFWHSHYTFVTSGFSLRRVIR